MSDTKHTPEPWIVYRNGREAQIRSLANPQYHIGDVDQSNGPSFRTNDADRIVSCVNACAGMPDPVAEIAALRAERDKLKSVISDCIEAMDERRGYCEMWEYKYGEEWDAEDAAARAAIEEG